VDKCELTLYTNPQQPNPWVVLQIGALVQADGCLYYAVTIVLGVVLNPDEKTVCLLRLRHAVMHLHQFQSAQNLTRTGSRSPAKAYLNIYKDK